MKNKAPTSLKMRAIALLSQREHSAMELRRKLLRIRADIARRAATPDAGREAEDDEPDEESASSAAAVEVDALLAWLQAHGYLSEERFVESRIHARASRYGSLRIRQELAQHGLGLGDAAREQLQASEFERARAVWQRKFGGIGRLAGDSAADERAAGESAANRSSADDSAADEGAGRRSTANDRDAARAEQARQIRFLTARGFAPELVRRVLRCAADEGLAED